MGQVWSAAEPDFNEVAQRKTPYADAVKEFAQANPSSFMVPGHGPSLTGGGRALQEFFGGNVVGYDLPVMIEGIDLGVDAPHAQARRLAAEAWGARAAWFMTNGASQASRTAALAVRGLGPNVMMQRSSHSSFIDGVLNAGLHPSFVVPNIDQHNGAAHGLTPEMLDSALATAENPVTSVYVVSPSYFGSVADVAGLARVAHKHDAALIVDCAWGAHFGFHELLPESPARLGADLVISSTHKLAGSLTQSAMLLLGDGRFTERLQPLVERAYMMTASTSASAILMASLDIARSAMATGRSEIGDSIRRAEHVRDQIRAHDRFSLLDDTFDAFDDIAATDPLRVVIDISQLGVTGHWVAGQLEQHRVYVEMATATVVVAVIGAAAAPNTSALIEALDATAQEVDRRRAQGETPDNANFDFPPMPAPGRLEMLPRHAYFADTEIVPATAAVGRISADSLAAYPPGIPNVIPGEVISHEVVEFLTAVAHSPTGYVRGANDPLVQTYRVLA